LPPFTRETAIEKVRLAENALKNKNPKTVALAYSKDSVWSKSG
jgi:nuclear transport factor 2 (NTF2) superfamily protein